MAHDKVASWKFNHKLSVNKLNMATELNSSLMFGNITVCLCGQSHTSYWDSAVDLKIQVTRADISLTALSLIQLLVYNCSVGESKLVYLIILYLGISMCQPRPYAVCYRSWLLCC